MAMEFDDLEAIYEVLAEAIDRVGPEGRALFLSKLALMLANELGDRKRVLDAIEACARNVT